MTYVITQPQMLAAAATDAAGIGSAIKAANVAAGESDNGRCGSSRR